MLSNRSGARVLGVRTRVSLWLLLVAAIVFGAGLVLVGLTQTRLEASSEDSLRQLLQLEQNRIVAALDDERNDVENAALEESLIRVFLDNGNPDEALNGLLDRSERNGRDFAAFTLIDRDGSLVGRTSLSSPQADELTQEAMNRRSTLVGLALENGTLSMVAPVVTTQGEVLGALIVEAELDTILWLTRRYESFSETSEVLVYQRLPDGTCQLLTNLRFDRTAAFARLGGDYGATCGDLAEDRILDAIDYRGVATRSAWTSIPSTDWGIAVKMDDAETFAILHAVRRIIVISGLAAAVVLIAGWFVLVRSIGSRLSRAASAAEQLAAGNFTAMIEDQRLDEIGRMSESMDCLARDLALDIERRELAEHRLRVRADTDELTGVMNRRRVNERLRQLTIDKRCFAIIFMDLDGFKGVNDTYGHSVGDDVLRRVTARIQTALKNSDTSSELGRWGGDEFVVLCTDCTKHDVADFVRLIDSHFDAPIVTATGQHRVGISIGTADTNDGASPEAIMSAADASMYYSKRQGQRHRPVSPKSIKFAEDALQEDRVVAFLQPLVKADGSDGIHLAGAEALVRIRNVDRTLALPDTFLPGLGTSEQALAIDLRVLDRAVAAAAQWHRDRVVPPGFYLAANFGAAAMADARLADKIASIIQLRGLSPTNLVVEIPETAEDIDIAMIEQLRRMGISIAIDDVGCQFSNLERLVDIPADVAKIDRRWIPDGSNKPEMLSGLIEQCRMLNLAVTVEGIETPTQLEVVCNIGVDHIQGFLFGRAMNTAQFERLWSAPGGASVRVVTPTHNASAAIEFDLRDSKTGTAQL